MIYWYLIAYLVLPTGGDKGTAKRDWSMQYEPPERKGPLAYS